MRSTVAVLVGIFVLSVVASGQDKPTVIKGGKLDRISLNVTKFPGSAATPIVVRKFSTEGVNSGSGGSGGSKDAQEDAARIKEQAPTLLATELAARLSKLGFFAKVTVVDDNTPVPSEALVIEGRFVKLDPGNRATRYMVGFGAGRSGVQIAGLVKDGSSKAVAEFTQERFGAMGVAGGNSMDKLTSDSRSIGQDIAEFIDAWARGKSLK
jgi:hypothetical protein